MDSQAESTALYNASYHQSASSSLECTAADLDEVQQATNEAQPAVRPRRQQLHAEPLDDALQRRRCRIIAGRLQDFGLWGTVDIVRAHKEEEQFLDPPRLRRCRDAMWVPSTSESTNATTTQRTCRWRF